MKFKSTVPMIILTLVTIAGIAMYTARFEQPELDAPAVDFMLLDGSHIRMSSLQGRPVLVSFWASTCHLCLQEIPGLITLYEELKPNGLEVIGVAMPYDPPNRVLETRDIFKIPYPIALDIDGTANRSFGGVTVTPTTILIGPDGRVIERFTGLLDFTELRVLIEKHSGLDDGQSVSGLTMDSPRPG